MSQKKKILFHGKAISLGLIRLKYQKVPLELIYRAQWQISFSENYFKGKDVPLELIYRAQVPISFPDTGPWAL